MNIGTIIGGIWGLDRVITIRDSLPPSLKHQEVSLCLQNCTEQAWLPEDMHFYFGCHLKKR